MSFTKNPFTNMGIVINPDGDAFGWSCESCGKSWPHFLGSSTVARLYNDFLYHVRTSHDLNEEDVREWS